MHAFVTNGPDVPELLLQAHEEGRVVFFCGAGISYPAGLPGFHRLVNTIYDELGAYQLHDEEQAFKSGQYDVTLKLLERRFPGQRLAVREVLAKVLKPKWRRKGATTTHQALLQLATDRKNKVRLVSTNFDRIFERVIKRQKLGIPSFSAPLLPIPKPSRWHGLVYLHGSLEEIPDESSLNRLVLTSGDIGLAYLTERWAARFVSELFRNYTVCFVGYSINDPVLRYMMDALSVDELLGETRHKAYAFACTYNDSYSREQTFIEWEAKGVTPLLYEMSTKTHDHSALHLTLKEWSDTYRDGVRGKELIIAQYAPTSSVTSSRSDFAVGRVLWALTDIQAAKHFADMNPVPPLKWIEPLSESQFRHEDLGRFGIFTNVEINNKLSFSFLRRCTPYTHSRAMCIADMGDYASNWDDIMFHLARWLRRHLNDPKLIPWLAKQGGQLNKEFVRLIRDRIDELDRLEKAGDQNELELILTKAPNAIPTSLMRTLWRLLLTGRLKSNMNDSGLYGWFDRFIHSGLTATLRLELREILAPRVIIREPWEWSEEPAVLQEPKHISDLVHWELAFSADDIHPALQDWSNNPEWQSALPYLLQDFTTLLRDTLDLKGELGGAEYYSDQSYIYQPSISKHTQNSTHHDWAALIDPTRDA